MKPAIILVAPQMGENIGAVARAMYNFSLVDLRLVSPRDGWPNQAAYPMASGADYILDKAMVFDSLQEAIADLHYTVASTARKRELSKSILTPRDMAVRLNDHQNSGLKTGIIFGPERSGLENDHIALAHDIVSVPLNPDFQSLNLAQSVLLLGYEWFQKSDAPKREYDIQKDVAAIGDLVFFQERLVSLLEGRGYFPTEEIKPVMIRNLKTIFTKLHLTKQEIQTLHGIIKLLQ